MNVFPSVEIFRHRLLSLITNVYKKWQGGGGSDFSIDRFSHRFTRNLALKALKILIVGYVMLKIMTRNLPGFKNEPQSEYHFFKCFVYVPSSMTVYS